MFNVVRPVSNRRSGKRYRRHEAAEPEARRNCRTWLRLIENGVAGSYSNHRELLLLDAKIIAVVFLGKGKKPAGLLLNL